MGPAKEIDIVSRCLVTETIQEGPAGSLDNRVICDDGTIVVLPRVVAVGSEIVFDSYYENDDTTTIHGYIKKVYDPIQSPKAD